MKNNGDDFDSFEDALVNLSRNNIRRAMERDLEEVMVDTKLKLNQELENEKVPLRIWNFEDRTVDNTLRITRKRGAEIRFEVMLHSLLKHFPDHEIEYFLDSTRERLAQLELFNFIRITYFTQYLTKHDLEDHEVNIMHYAIRNRSTTSEITDLLCQDMDCSASTVETWKTNLLRRLQLKSISDITELADIIRNGDFDGDGYDTLDAEIKAFLQQQKKMRDESEKKRETNKTNKTLKVENVDDPRAYEIVKATNKKRELKKAAEAIYDQAKSMSKTDTFVPGSGPHYTASKLNEIANEILDKLNRKRPSIDTQLADDHPQLADYFGVRTKSSSSAKG